jgi:hypothetical protein
MDVPEISKQMGSGIDQTYDQSHAENCHANLGRRTHGHFAI